VAADIREVKGQSFSIRPAGDPIALSLRILFSNFVRRLPPLEATVTARQLNANGGLLYPSQTEQLLQKALLPDVRLRKVFRLRRLCRRRGEVLKRLKIEQLDRYCSRQRRPGSLGQFVFPPALT
jgi:hypothetical protein